jgi:hypothetical protein
MAIDGLEITETFGESIEQKIVITSDSCDEAKSSCHFAVEHAQFSFNS